MILTAADGMTVQKLQVYAGCIVFAPDGKILCQQRDNKKNIPFPGYWVCTPGGHVKKNEEPSAAVPRELQEEFEISVSELAPLQVIIESDFSVRGIYWAFTANLSSPLEKVKCNEGQSAVFLPFQEALKLKQHPISKRFLQYYFRSQ